MKKVYLLILMAMCSFASHAIVLSADGIGDIDADTTITITEAEMDPLTGAIQMEIHGNLLLINGTALKVEITRSASGVADQFCCGSNCVNGNLAETETLNFTVASKMSSWFTHYAPAPGSVYTVTYKFIDGSHAITLTVNYDYSGTGIADLKAESTKKGVYTILGERVREDNSIEGLRPGLYIINGKKQIIK